MTRNAKLLFSSLFLIGWFFLASPAANAADEITNQVAQGSATLGIDSSTVIVVKTPTEIILDANTSLSQAESKIASIKDDAKAIENITSEETAFISSADFALSQADIAISAAKIVISHQSEAQVSVDTAIVEKNIAITNLETATANYNTANATYGDLAKKVQDQTTVVSQETSELNALKNTTSDSYTYTTAGYVAPDNIGSGTVTTTVLPPMGDAATKIQTPFDIKLGNTVFEGQGNNSQLYVTSKSALTFGAADWTYYDWPTVAGIYVFQSDYMSSGPGASITVTTTNNTLAISWDLHRFGDNSGPITNTDLNMIVNPNTGEWTATVSISGNTNVYGGPRTGMRETNNGNIISLNPVAAGDLSSQISSQENLVTTETAKLQTLTTQKNEAYVIKNTTYQTMNQAQSIANSTSSEATAALQNLAIAKTNTEESLTSVANKLGFLSNAVISAKTAIDNKLQFEAAARQAARAAAQAAAAQAAAAQAAAEAAAAQAAAQAAAEAKAAAEAAAAQAAAEAKAAAEAAAQAKSEAAAQAAAEAKAAAEAAAQAKAEAEAAAKSEAEANAIKDAAEKGTLTEAQKEIIADQIIAESNGEAINSEDLLKAGLDFADLPPETPVDVRTDENGNAVVITAQVAANLELLANPGELLAEAFTNPGAALAALGSIGADMSPAEREEATDMVVATVVAAGAAMNAVGAATSGGTTSGGSSGGGGGGGSSGSGKGSAGSRRNERW